MTTFPMYEQCKQYFPVMDELFITDISTLTTEWLSDDTLKPEGLYKNTKMFPPPNKYAFIETEMSVEDFGVTHLGWLLANDKLPLIEGAAHSMEIFTFFSEPTSLFELGCELLIYLDDTYVTIPNGPHWTIPVPGSVAQQVLDQYGKDYYRKNVLPNFFPLFYALTQGEWELNTLKVT